MFLLRKWHICLKLLIACATFCFIIGFYFTEKLTYHRKSTKPTFHSGNSLYPNESFEQDLYENTENKADIKNSVNNKINEIKKLKKEVEEISEKLKRLKQPFYKHLYPEVVFKTYKDSKRILVTGGAGFMGSHLVDRLMMDGHQVTVVDNFATGHKENIEHWIGHENFEFLNHDVTHPLYIEVDQIYHLASSSPHDIGNNPIKGIKTSMLGTVNMLGLARRIRATFLLASVDHVYGEYNKGPIPESYWGSVDMTRLNGYYAESKRISETMCYAYQKQEKIEVRVARIFSTIGPRMRLCGSNIMSTILHQAIHNHSLVRFPANQVTSFLYIDDLIDALVSLMTSNHSAPVNIGSDKKVSLEHVGRQVRQIVDEQKGSERWKETESNTSQWISIPDTSTARDILKWKQKITPEQALRNTIPSLFSSPASDC